MRLHSFSIFSFVWLFVLLAPFVYSETGLPLTEHFDPQRAFAHIQKQTEFGPRPSGSIELQKTRDYLISELRSYGLEVREQVFTEKTPRGPIRFVNILASVPKSSLTSFFKKEKPVILIASHYDTKWLPNIRFVGANDGASSTAVLLEIARVIGKTKFQPKDSCIEFAFFDGEEAVIQYGKADGLYGSRYYVQQMKAESKDDKPSHILGMILMDMVGDRDLSIQITDSSPELSKRIFEASKTLSFRDFFCLSPGPMTDDHSPFLEAGIPAIDLIDFEYGPHHRWWHTEEDTLDKISPDSLKIIGRTVLKLLEGF